MRYKTYELSGMDSLIILTGCGRRIPNVVTPEEYEVYSAFGQNFKNRPESKIYLATETSRFRDCHQKQQQQGGMDSIRRQRADLGGIPDSRTSFAT
jgi:hypothetical protein